MLSRLLLVLLLCLMLAKSIASFSDGGTADESGGPTKRALAEGRTFGTLRRIKMAIPAIMYKLGVMSTVMIFLTIFALKGLMIGVVLVIFQFSHLLAKFHALKPDWGGHQGHGQDIHLHIHGDRGHYHYEHPHESSPWDKSDSRLEDYLFHKRLREMSANYHNLYAQGQ